MPVGLVERAVHAARAYHAADPDGFVRRHGCPDQWNRWARRARVARTVVAALQVPVDRVHIPPLTSHPMPGRMNYLAPAPTPQEDAVTSKPSDTTTPSDHALPPEAVLLAPAPPSAVPLRPPAGAWGLVVVAVRTTDAAGAPVRYVGDAPRPDPPTPTPPICWPGCGCPPHRPPTSMPGTLWCACTHPPTIPDHDTEAPVVTFTKHHRDDCPFITSTGAQDCDEECFFEHPADAKRRRGQ
jgi:hypothetical protein